MKPWWNSNLKKISLVNISRKSQKALDLKEFEDVVETFALQNTIEKKIEMSLDPTYYQVKKKLSVFRSCFFLSWTSLFVCSASSSLVTSTVKPPPS
jgi:tryptophan-rich sensory protein